MSVELLDLEQVVKDYAIDFLDPDQKKVADLKNPIINWDRMLVFYGETEYTQPGQPPKPRAHVLFSANFANNTPKPQTYTLRTSRTTKSTSSVTFTKSFSYGANVQVKLGPPNPVIEANAGFQMNMTKSKGATQSFEQEMTWAVDNQIEVPPGFQTKAELVFHEDNYNGEFEMEVTFEGKILVTFENRKTREHVTTVVENVSRIFNGQPGFRKDDKGRPVYIVKGVCKSKFGVKQNVKLTESEINPDEEEDGHGA